MDTNTAAGAKEAGNAAYKAGRFDVAVALYSKAIELCDDESQRKVCLHPKPQTLNPQPYPKPFVMMSPSARCAE